MMSFSSKSLRITTISAMACAGLMLSPVSGASVTYKQGDKYVKLGGRIQLQYHQISPDVGSDTDTLFFRRLRLYIEGSVVPDWKGKFQWDMGGSKLSIKDAYMQYTGLDNLNITVGNANFPFSRELLTSSKKQQLIERTFVGDHNYGTADRNLGVHVKGHNADKRWTWAASVAQAAQDPDNKKLDFDTPVSHGKGSDWSEGWMLGGRIDFHPFGHLKMSQGDFKGDQKITVGVAAFTWQNDDDNLDPADLSKSDVDNVTGIEISGAFRQSGVSIDAEYNGFNADLSVSGITNGLYKNSSTTLTNWSIESGYMVMPKTLEIVVGFSSQDADNYATTWDRASVGANYFVKGHKIKYQLTYRQNSNMNGVSGVDENELFAQAQYVF